MHIYDMAYMSKISVEQIGKNFNIEKFSDGFYYRVVVWKNRVFEKLGNNFYQGYEDEQFFFCYAFIVFAYSGEA